MPNYDFKCIECGNIDKDIFYWYSWLEDQIRPGTEESPVYEVQCSIHGCQHTGMIQHYGTDRNFIDFDNPSMYGTTHRGKYHPGFGEEVTSYGHKNQLLKKYGCIEASDSIGGSRTVMGDSEVMRGYQHDPKRPEEKRRAQEKANADKQNALNSLMWSG